MLRYHLFTVGRFWIQEQEYGSAEDPADFAYLRRYSPYHNVADRTPYPPTLVMTANTDDRVDPDMAKKFAARLQEAVTGVEGGLILLRVERRTGHGAGKPIGKQIEEHTDLYAFLFQYLTGPPGSEQQHADAKWGANGSVTPPAPESKRIHPHGRSIARPAGVPRARASS